MRGDADLVDDVRDHGLKIRLARSRARIGAGSRARLRRLPDAADEQLRRAGLGQEIRRAQLRRLGEHLLRIEPGDDDRAGAAALLLQLLQHGEAVRLRQDHVRDEHVRVLLAHEGERLLPVVRRADERHVVLAFYQTGHHLAKIFTGIGQKHADFGCHNIILRRKFRSRDAACLFSLYHRFFSNNLARKPCRNNANRHDLVAEFVDIIPQGSARFATVRVRFGDIRIIMIRNDGDRQKDYVNSSSTKFDKQRRENPPSGRTAGDWLPHHRRDEHRSSACRRRCAGGLRTTNGRPYDRKRAKTARRYFALASARAAEGVGPYETTHQRRGGYTVVAPTADSGCCVRAGDCRERCIVPRGRMISAPT